MRIRMRYRTFRSSIVFAIFLCLGWGNAEKSLSLGEICVSPKDLSVTFPAYINLEKGVIEFALVNINGKIHESLLFTKIKGSELNTALRLIGLKGSDKNASTPPPLESLNNFPRVSISIAKRESVLRWVPLHHFIINSKKSRDLEKADWRYSSSYFYENRFLSDSEGDLIAIYTNPSALINLRHADRNDDTAWIINEKKTLAYGTEVFIKIEKAE